MTAEKKEMADLIINNSLAYQCGQIEIVTKYMASSSDISIKLYPTRNISQWSQHKLTAALDLAEIRTYVDYDPDRSQCFLVIY